MRFFRTAFLMCGTILLGVIVFATPRVQASLTIYFQSTLKDQAHQQKTFKKVRAAWKPPASSRYPKVGSPLPHVVPRRSSLSAVVATIHPAERRSNDVTGAPPR